MAGIFLASAVEAQEASWQGQPRRRARPVARHYADDTLPRENVAAAGELPDLKPPLPQRIDSPSDQPAGREKPAPAEEPVRGEKKPAPAEEPVKSEKPARPRETPAARRPAAEETRSDGQAADDIFPRRPAEGESFGWRPGDPTEECGEADDAEFGYSAIHVRGLLRNRLWFRGEGLMWWTKGGQVPALLTTSPDGTARAQAGVLGQAGTTVLFGNQELNTGLHAGSRMTFGYWLDECEQSGFEFSYLILGENRETYNSTSNGSPILARPFFDVSTALEDSHLVAYPNAFSGTFNASSTENFQGAEALWRRSIVRGCDGRIDFLAGYRFQRLTGGLQINDVVTTAGTGAPTTINVTDTFHTRNDFHGADIGFATKWQRNRWSFDTLLKLGIGQTHTQVLVDGWTTVNTSIGYSGGQLALPSNMGTHHSRQFSVVPELGVTLGYDLTPRLKASIGYTFLYWSNVARPGDQIDLNVDPAQFPPPTATGRRPAFALHTSDFWAQGINLGLDCRF